MLDYLNDCDEFTSCSSFALCAYLTAQQFCGRYLKIIFSVLQFESSLLGNASASTASKSSMNGVCLTQNKERKPLKLKWFKLKDNMNLIFYDHYPSLFTFT